MELIIAKICSEICSVIALGLSCFVLGRNSVKMDDLKDKEIEKEIEKVTKIKPFRNDNK